MKRSSAWLVVLLLAAGCGDDSAPAQVFTMEITSPSGDDPLVGASSVTLRVQQGDGEVLEREVDVSDGKLSSDVELADLITRIRVGVEVDGALIGAPPAFVPVEATSFVVRIPVGPPDTCARVEGMTLDAPRAHVGVARHGTFALAIGGEGASGPSSAAGFLDLLELDTGAFDPLDTALGPTRAAPYNSAQSVVLSEEAGPFRYDIGSSEMPVLLAALHAGAGYASAAVALGARGSAVLGGRDGAGDPVAGITWIAPDGTTTSSMLAVARAEPQVAVLDGALLVAGGGSAEIVPFGGNGIALADPVPDRAGAALVASGDGHHALLAGGTDPATRLFACEAAICTVTDGPPFARTRSGFAVAELPGGGALLAGGDGPVALVDRVTFDGAVPSIVPAGDLETARAGATALVIDSGLVYVLGGMGPSGPLADVELCFPSSLTSP